MKIWLINPYGPIPGEGWRDYRFTMLGGELARRGHKVIWWTGNFSHHFKQFRAKGWKDLKIQPDFTIRLTPTSSYQSNVSLARLLFETRFARNFYQRALYEGAPDIIIGTDPSQIVGYTCVKMANKLNVPLILDIFDLWPELFVLALPGPLRPLAPAIFLPFYLLRQYNLRHATAITALCNTYRDVAKHQVPQLKEVNTLTVFNGIDVAIFRSHLPNIEEANNLKQEMGKQPNDVWVIYAGTLGNNYDVLTMLYAAEILERYTNQIKLLIVGEGPLRNTVTEFIKQHRLRNTTYLGKLAPQELTKLYGICDVGLCAYAPESNVAMPDKAYDYMAAGLAIINSLRGELANLLQEKRIGLQYEAGDQHSLAQIVAHLANNHDQRSQMASNSFQAAIEFDKSVQYRKFVDFIEDVYKQ